MSEQGEQTSILLGQPGGKESEGDPLTVIPDDNWEGTWGQLEKLDLQRGNCVGWEKV